MKIPRLRESRVIIKVERDQTAKYRQTLAVNNYCILMHINTDQLRERPESTWNSTWLAGATRTVACIVWPRSANLTAEDHTP